MKGKAVGIMNIIYTLAILGFVCLCVVAGCGKAFADAPQMSNSANAVPVHKSGIVENVARYGSFIMRLGNYDDHFLYDIRPLGGGRMGVIMFSPRGYEKNFVFQFSGTGITSIYEYVRAPQKTTLGTIREKAIPVCAARKFATEVVRQNEEYETILGHA